MAGPKRGGCGIAGLAEAVAALGLEGEVSLSGRWLKLQGARFPVYVVESAWGAGYYTWCDGPGQRAVEFYPEPLEAIRTGLRRAT
ncbi:MAG: hypothetical protein AVDCRST_MAG01-01-893 [uncultured Rubrobacteraceae bacterium]|uniref:Uncharacterized protein n=1 Tax=uncultured Rubrobacteraceae bacterium TaxID=349277 RepID=A0A6J4NVZ5_9ACTN|nr:MAG: hypothetical protein AVDCRST_MAG01-01-893 [uncultured Rubrobacteraceae bacterium]